jgi:hypothetical protein
MIAGQAGESGVAPQARLLSAATNIGIGGLTLEQEMEFTGITMQHVATRESDQVWAINVSGVIPVPAGGAFDGRSTLTKFVDWSATQHDVLYVVGGNTGMRNSFPADNYNGLTVGMTRKMNDPGKWNQVDVQNDSNADDFGRNLTSLVAPGVGVKSANPSTDGHDVVDGTSFAAPHVTGTVGLLQHYAKARIDAQAPGWTGVTAGFKNPQRHEVMKAVILNSVDKIQDSGDNKRLLQTRDVFMKDGTSTWLDSQAYADPTLPIDAELGTGQLNAKRAVIQFESGEIEPGSPNVPAIGWDFGETNGQGTITKYAIKPKLVGDSFISITLAWDRVVNLIDNNANGKYDAGEGFVEPHLFDLDLFLVPKATQQPIDESISVKYNVEHIFFRLPAGDAEYEIWVRQTDTPGGTMLYALAWWAFPKPEQIPGASPVAVLGAMSGGGSQGDGAGGGGLALLWEKAPRVSFATAPQEAYSATYDDSAIAAGLFFQAGSGLLRDPAPESQQGLGESTGCDSLERNVDLPGFDPLTCAFWSRIRRHVAGWTA